MQQDGPRTVSTAQLRRLLAAGGPLWLVFVPDHATFAAGHIPGSLIATDEQLLRALPAGTPMVIYGEGPHATAARSLAAELAATGRDARWYAAGLLAWAAAGLPVDGSPGAGTPQ